MAASAASAAVCGDQDISVEFYSPRTARVLKTPVGATFHKPFETRAAKTWDGTVTVKSGDVTSWSTGELEVRLDAPEIVGERRHLGLPQLVAEEKLPVEIGLAYRVKVAQGETAHSRAHQMGGRVATEAARAGDADFGLRQELPLAGAQIGIGHSPKIFATSSVRQ